jgi:hypothetical protein
MATQYCRHIRINGERCGSPALNSAVFCYYHVELDRRHHKRTPTDAAPADAQPDLIETILHPMTLQDGSQRDPILAEPTTPSTQLDFPPLEDRYSIQLALSMLITALAQNRIDPKRAALLFYGLQVASANARDLNPLLPVNKRPGKVRSTVVDITSGTLIAPDEDPEGEKEFEPMGTVGKYMLRLEKEDAERDAKKQAERDRQTAEAAIIPPLLPLI